MIFAVTVLMSTAASAIEFTFAPVDKVAQSGNGFFAYSGDEAVAISALQYTQMRNTTGYYLLDVDGQKTIAAGDEFVVESLTADSVGLDGTQPKVFFTNGTARTFSKSEWLKTLKGQTVRRIYINTPTWEFENFATVNKGEVVIYHDPVAPVKAQAKVEAPAPTKVEAPAPAKVEAPKAETKVEAPTPAPAQSANGNVGGITFKVTH